MEEHGITQPDIQQPDTSPGPDNKLRSTCDRCTALKVRCKKQKPACERCDNFGLKCVYSPYRWKGRPSSTRDATALSPAATVTSNPLGATSSPPEDNSQHNYLPANDSTLPAYDDAFLSVIESTFDEGFNAAPIDLNIPPWKSLCLPAPTQGASLAPPPESADIAADLVPHHNFHDSPILPSSETTDVDPTAPAIGQPNCHSCVDVALETLRKLHGIPSETSPCTPENTNPGNMMNMIGNPGNGSLSTEYALKINRAALQKMNLIISRGCSNCSSDSNIDLLLYTICSRMLNRYQKVFHCIRQHQPSHGDRGTACHPSPSCAETLYFNPVQFGDFHIDVPATQRLNLQLLLYELKGLGKFLDALNKYGENLAISGGYMNTNPGKAGDPTSKPACTYVHEAFRQFLTSSIRSLALEIDEHCQSLG